MTLNPSFAKSRSPSLLGLLSCVLLLTNCSHKENDTHLQIFHGTLSDDIKTWDPANAYDGISLAVVPNIYQTLYEYDYLSRDYRLIPLLAADVPKVSKDQLTYTIRLKPGVFFQDDPCFISSQGKGRELVAEDFIYGWKRLADSALQSQGWWIFDGKIAGINTFRDRLKQATNTEQVHNTYKEVIEGVRALDQHTLQIRLTRPYPQLLSVLAMTFTAPIAEESVRAYGDSHGSLLDHAIGTGPFILKNWERNRRIVLERSPHYHTDFYPTQGDSVFKVNGLLKDTGKTLPFLDRVEFEVIRESQPRWLNFLKGSRDVLQLSKDHFQQAISARTNLSTELASKGLRLHIESGIVFRYVSFNVKDPLLSNKFLRQALASAINREDLIETFTNGTGQKMSSALPPGVPDRPIDARLKYDYNLDRAKELLAKAGYPAGKGLPLLTLDLRGGDSTNRQMGEFYQRQWSAIGVQVHVITNTFPLYLEKQSKGQFQIADGAWAMDYPDPENVYQLLYGPNDAPGPNETHFNHPEMNRLYQEMAKLSAGTKRADLIRRMDEIVQEESPWAMLYYQSTYMLSQPWLFNYRARELATQKLKYLRIDNDIKKRYLSQ